MSPPAAISSSRVQDDLPWSTYHAGCEQGGRRTMSDSSQGDGWWIASDGKWYAPELHPTAVATSEAEAAIAAALAGPATAQPTTAQPAATQTPAAAQQAPAQGPPAQSQYQYQQPTWGQPE